MCSEAVLDLITQAQNVRKELKWWWYKYLKYSLSLFWLKIVANVACCNICTTITQWNPPSPTTSCDSAICRDLPLFEHATDTFFWTYKWFLLPPKYLCSEGAVLTRVEKECGGRVRCSGDSSKLFFGLSHSLIWAFVYVTVPATAHASS